MQKQKFNISSMIEKEELDGLVQQAMNNLQKEGGNPTSALMYVQMLCDGKVGAAVALRGETTLTEPLKTVIRELQEQDLNIGRFFIEVIVTLFDGPRFGTAVTGSIDPANYYDFDET